MNYPDSLPRPLDWMDDAACINHATLVPEDWFTAEIITQGSLLNQVKAACNIQCNVQAECLKLAMDEDIPSGIWGGLTSSERRRITRDQHRTTALNKLKGLTA